MPGPDIDVDALVGHLASGARLLDVRQQDEYEDGHISGAQLIPLGELPARIGELDTNGPLYVVCASGGRSRRASEFLVQRGIDATNVAGGMVAWVQAGNDVVTGSEPGPPLGSAG